MPWLVEDAEQIDLRELLRVRPGRSRRWRVAAEGPGQRLLVEVDLDMPCLRIRVEQGWRDVALERERSSLGFFRWYARCPRCSRRVLHLRRPAWSSTWGCRECFALVYATSVAGRIERARLKAARARRRLGAPGYPGGPVPARPPGRHRKRWEELTGRLRAADATYENAVMDKLSRGWRRRAA